MQLPKKTDRNIRYTPVRELWLKHGKGLEVHVVLRGFIDESYDDAVVPKVFTLSCLVSDDSMWPWFEMAWVKVLEEKNEQLSREGRPQISRYHAADCSSLKGEFKDWTVGEQIEFSLKLFDVFKKYPVHIHSYDVPLQLLVQEFPETKANPIGFAYVNLLIRLMIQIGDTTLTLYPRDVISLHHDQSKYDGALADTFRDVLSDATFKYRNRYTSITPEQWQHCMLLQPADMIAYENFKEGMRFHYPKGRDRRRSLKALLDLDAVSGRASGMNLDTIRELKVTMDSLNKETRDRIFGLARIRTH